VSDLFKLGTPPLELVVRTLFVYVMFLVALRVFGKREIGQFTIFDLALILLAANALQPAITGPDTSITGAAIIIATIFVLNWLVGVLRSRYPPIRRLLENEPAIVGRDGKWDQRAVEREGLDDVDLDAALRQHGLADVAQMKLAVLEEDGSISVVPVDDGEESAARRRRRYRRRQSL
jgi:uncharacterized membrane protein YcaP (DUF421 family)